MGKRSVNFRGGLGSKKNRRSKNFRGFIDLAEWVGMPNEKIVATVKEIEDQSHNQQIHQTEDSAGD